MANRGRRGFGSLYRLEGIWYARWTERGFRKKKRIGRDRALGERFLAKKAADLDREEALGIRAIESIRFADLVAQYSTIFSGEKSAMTIYRESSYIKSTIAPYFKRMLMEDIRREDIERFLAKRVSEGIAPGTRNRLLSVLSALFKKALRLNHCRENPCAGIKRSKESLLEPAVPRRRCAEGPREGHDAQDPERRPAVARHGLRKGELLRLTWQDVDFNRRVVTVRISKTKKPRIVPVTARGIEALEGQRVLRGTDAPAPTELVFAEIAVFGKRGEAMLRGGAEKAWKDCRAKAGFADLRWHDLRHVFAVTAARAGVPLGDLMKILGHSSLIMSMRYAHHAPANSGDLARTRLETFLRGEVREDSECVDIAPAAVAAAR